MRSLFEDVWIFAVLLVVVVVINFPQSETQSRAVAPQREESSPSAPPKPVPPSPRCQERVERSCETRVIILRVEPESREQTPRRACGR